MAPPKGWLSWLARESGALSAAADLSPGCCIRAAWASFSEYSCTAGAVHSVGLHLVWFPKYRKPVLVGPVAERLNALLYQKAVERGWFIEALQVMADRLRLLVHTGPDASPKLVARQCKGCTLRVLGAGFPQLRWRLPTLWSTSYLCASVGRVSEATVGRYIAKQPIRPGKGNP
jgi:putative transposase